MVSVFVITYGASQQFYGPLGDQLGKFRVVTFATLGYSVGSIVAVFATSLDVLVMARLLMALGGLLALSDRRYRVAMRRDATVADGAAARS